MLPGKGPQAAAGAQWRSGGVSAARCWLPPESSGAGTGAGGGLQAGWGTRAGWQAPAAERLAGTWVAARREKEKKKRVIARVSRKNQFTGHGCPSLSPVEGAQPQQNRRWEGGQLIEGKGALNLNTVREPMFKTHLNARYVTRKDKF